MLITSRQNQFIKKIKKLLRSNSFRREEKLFVVEGLHLADEVLLSGLPVKSFIFDSERILTNPEIQKIEKKCQEQEIEVVNCNSQCFDSFSLLKSPEGVAALLSVAENNFESLNEKGRYVILDNIQDTGNCGTIVRTAAAAGFDAVFFYGGSVDIYNPSYLRATMGAFLKIPCVSLSLDEIKSIQKKNNIALISADGRGDISYKDADYSAPYAIVVGSEGQGVSDEILDISSCKVSIPMANNIESLNAATAAAIICYQAKD